MKPRSNKEHVTKVNFRGGEEAQHVAGAGWQCYSSADGRKAPSIFTRYMGTGKVFPPSKIFPYLNPVVGPPADYFFCLTALNT